MIDISNSLESWTPIEFSTRNYLGTENRGNFSGLWLMMMVLGAIEGFTDAKADHQNP
jgi:hypothetical protein